MQMAKLRKAFNFYGLTMIAVGSCIGAGIFVTPAKIAEAVPEFNMIILVWILGGIISICGALTFAELGGMFPNSGGVYNYIREAFGSLPAFLFGWTTLLVVTSGAIAALSLAMCKYVSFFIPMSDWQQQLMAIGMITTLTLLNLRNVNTSQFLASFFSTLKLIAIGAIILVGLFFAGQIQVVPSAQIVANTSKAGTGILAALIGVLWSYGGWYHTSFVSGEALNPKRDVPRAMVTGVGIVMLAYVLCNLSYLKLLSIPQIIGTEKVAADALQQVFNFGGQAVSIIIILSIFGSIAIFTMSSPRIYYRMAKDGVFFKGLAQVNERTKTPVRAILLQSGWAILLVLVWKTFHNLISYVVFVDFAFLMLAAIGVIVLRNKRPEVNRPVKVWGYPIVPLIFILVIAAFLVNTLFNKPNEALTGLGLIVLGCIVYFIFWKKGK